MACITFLLLGQGIPPSVTAAARSASADTPQCPHHSLGTLWHEDLVQISLSERKCLLPQILLSTSQVSELESRVS